MPVVEGGELVDQVHEGGDLALSVVTHDLAGGGLGRDARPGAHLALDETLHAGGQRAICDGLVVGGEASVELEVVASDRVVRVVLDRVEVLGHGSPLLAGRVTDILGVEKGAVVDGVVETGLLDTTQDVVESAVLQQDPNDVLDLVLQVGNGLLGARGVAKGLRGAAGNSSAEGAAGETEEGKESVGLHD